MRYNHMKSNGKREKVSIASHAAKIIPFSLLRTGEKICYNTVTNVSDLTAKPYDAYRFFRISAELP